jgi:NHL repeat
VRAEAFLRIRWRECFALKAGLALSVAIAILPGLGLGIGSSTASATLPLLWDKCDRDEPIGRQCEMPRGIAADPDNGHVFVADQANNRVIELSALGEFMRTWGWDVLQGGGTAFEICEPENGEECKPGIAGSGVGQLSDPLGLAGDSGDNVYVVDFSNTRVQKFDPDGDFLLSFGTPGTGSGQFSWTAVGDFITIDSSDNVYVGGEERIQRFNTAGIFQDACSVPGAVQSLDVDSSGNLYATYEFQVDVRKLVFVAGGVCDELQRFELPKLSSPTQPVPIASAVAVSETGHVFAFGPTFDPTTGSPGSSVNPVDPIIEFDATGSVVDHFGKDEFAASTGLATNLCAGSQAPGNLYVTNLAPPHSNEAFVRAYGSEPIGCLKARTLPATNVTETGATLNGTVNPKGEAVSECFFEYGTTTAYGQVAACEDPAAGEIGSGETPVAAHADVGGLQAGTVYHVRLRARVGGELESGTDVSFKTLGPPVISDSHVVSATHDEATVKALVNPEGFPTTCHVEYGPDTEYGQSTRDVQVGSDRAEHAVVTVLEGLAPSTTYHWRYVCNNTSGAGVTEGADRSLTTDRLFIPDTNCPNQTFRGGYSAPLPDCRAYEMVSPVDKNGADIVSKMGGDTDPGGYVQAAPDGERITYSALFPAFGDDPPSSFVFNQYLATRHPDEGWTSEGINAPHLSPTVGAGLFRVFIAFTPDLCSAWLKDFQSPPLNPDGQPEAGNLYRRDNCDLGAGNFETLTTAPVPEGVNRETYVSQDSVQGVSEDARHAIFVADAKLTEDAAEGTAPQLYDRFGDEIHLVSVRLDGTANTGAATTGSGWSNNLHNAVSKDGSRVYWTAGVRTGKIFLRLHPEQGIVEDECTNDATIACTIPVSATTNAFFWAAAVDGSKALYSEGENLFEFDLATKESQLLASNVMGVAGTSEDLSRVYLVSRKALPGSGTNSEGEEAIEGEANLYFAEGGSFAFIGTLVEGDVGAQEPGAAVLAYYIVDRDLDDRGTYLRATRITPDGAHIAFQSRAPLTGFDNTTDAGKAAVEVFTYEAGGELECVSCNPSGGRPQSREIGEPYAKNSRFTGVQAAAWIPTWEHPLHASNVLSADGRRLFFNSNDALLPRDTNGAQDVYEWEALGTGGCDTEDSGYFPQNGGCLYLISSADSSFESEFWEASPDGDDVFFTTAASLLPQDPGSLDLYDARVGGGFPQPPPPAECEGEACQSAPPAPEFPAPASGTYQGPGNSPQAHNKRRCTKHKRRVRRRGKVRCVKKHRRHHKKHRANHNQRAGR